MRERSMREFWDARAAEDAYHFVDSRQRYGAADEERFWSGGTEALDAVLSRLGIEISAGDSVVEIGCGIGRITRPLAARAARVLALDVSPRMLDRARELNPALDNVTWLLGDGRSLDGIETGSAAGCLSFVVFQHIPDPEVTLGYVAEIGRVLRPGGWAAIHVSNSPDVHRAPSPLARARSRLRALLGRGPRGQDDPAWLGSAVDLDRLRETARGAGMETERVIGAGTQYCQVLLRRG